MSNHDWPPSNEPKQEVIKLLNQETIQDISDRIVGDEKLESILELYGAYDSIERSSDITNKAVDFFLTRHPNQGSFKNYARPNVPAEELLAKFPDLPEAVKAFKTIMYGKDGEISYMRAPKHDQEVDTQESIPASTNFKAHSEVTEAKQVEFQRDVIQICEKVLDNKQFRGILAEFTLDDFSARDSINKDNVLKRVNQFLESYDSLENFESRGDVTGFLSKFEGETKKKEYVKVVADFEDMIYGHHKER